MSVLTMDRTKVKAETPARCGLCQHFVATGKGDTLAYRRADGSLIPICPRCEQQEQPTLVYLSDLEQVRI